MASAGGPGGVPPLCPSCGDVTQVPGYRPNARFCPQCGSRLSQLPGSRPTSAQARRVSLPQAAGSRPASSRLTPLPSGAAPTRSPQGSGFAAVRKSQEGALAGAQSHAQELRASEAFADSLRQRAEAAESSCRRAEARAAQLALEIAALRDRRNSDPSTAPLATDARAAPLSHPPPPPTNPYTLSPNVLLLDAGGRSAGRARVSDVVRGLAGDAVADAVCVPHEYEPDTPTKNSAPGFPSFGAAGSSFFPQGGGFGGGGPAAKKVEGGMKQYYPGEAMVETHEMSALAQLEAVASMKDDTPIAEHIIRALRQAWCPLTKAFYYDVTKASRPVSASVAAAALASGARASRRPPSRGAAASAGPHGSPPPNTRMFADALLKLCVEAARVLRQERAMVKMKSPCYVFGDIHGNYADLSLLTSAVVPFGDFRYSPSSLLFLGDYVDRGPHSVECAALLLAYKCIAKDRVVLLRGNHESPEVNGDFEGYGTTCFKAQCTGLLGPAGEDVWRAFNSAFQQMPLCATIDSRIFCAHGGFPRVAPGQSDKRADLLREIGGTIPKFAEVQGDGKDSPRTAAARQAVIDLVWSDPADEAVGAGGAAAARLDGAGFGASPRGPSCCTFGRGAVDSFLKAMGCEMMFRAHQEKADGLKLSADFRVVTVFSTSDYGGHQELTWLHGRGFRMVACRCSRQNGAGFLFVDGEKVRLGIKRPDEVPG